MYCIDNDFNPIFFLILVILFSECLDLGAICFCGKTERFYMNFDNLVLQSVYILLMVSLVLLKYFDDMMFKICNELFKMY